MYENPGAEKSVPGFFCAIRPENVTEYVTGFG